jgi:LAO/AO transport system kinase
MIPVLKTDALRNLGMKELIDAIQNHQSFLTKSGERVLKAREFLRNEVFDILSERLAQSVEGAFQTVSGEEVVEQMLKRELDPYTAADLISKV